MPETVAAASLAVLREGRFLLVRRGRAPARGLYAFPGGRSEPGETPDQTARRELVEETGLSALRLEHLAELQIPAEGDGHGYRLSVFRGWIGEGEAVASDDAEAVGWFSIAEMESLPVTLSTLEMARAIQAEETQA